MARVDASPLLLQPPSEPLSVQGPAERAAERAEGQTAETRAADRAEGQAAERRAAERAHAEAHRGSTGPPMAPGVTRPGGEQRGVT